jgi:hypothetical protein
MGRKKIIYIAIIVICLGSSGAILYFGWPSTVTSPDITTDPGVAAPVSPTPTAAAPGGPQTYSAPPVFPSNNKFDWNLLDQPGFKIMAPSPTIDAGQLKTELGRDNPFLPY